MPYNSHYQGFKNSLKLNLTDDCSLPLECRKSHQMLLSVKKLVNSKTGEVKYQLTQLRPVQYEFDFEALADYKYTIGGQEGLTNRE